MAALGLCCKGDETSEEHCTTSQLNLLSPGEKQGELIAKKRSSCNVAQLPSPQRPAHFGAPWELKQARSLRNFPHFQSLEEGRLAST